MTTTHESGTAHTWTLIHAERAALVETLRSLRPDQWAAPSLCDGWTVQQLAAHIVAGAEQTGLHFAGGMLATGLRFNAMVRRDVERRAGLTTGELVERLAARTTTRNRPPAPVAAMLGEIVVHGEDLRRPLGVTADVSDEAVAACLEMYRAASFPVGGRARIRGLRLVASDLGWSTGEGPEVTGPGLALVLAMTGRAAGLTELEGAGVALLRERVQPASAAA
jgi:uncharacterized protein (TIGR03083 family)